MPWFEAGSGASESALLSADLDGNPGLRIESVSASIERLYRATYKHGNVQFCHDNDPGHVRRCPSSDTRKSLPRARGEVSD